MPGGAIEGYYHDNPILNSFPHDADFPDGQAKEFSANIAADMVTYRLYLDGFQATMCCVRHC